MELNFLAVSTLSFCGCVVWFKTEGREDATAIYKSEEQGPRYNVRKTTFFLIMQLRRVEDGRRGLLLRVRQHSSEVDVQRNARS